MAHESTDQLLEEAKQGRKLTPKERRRVIAYLEETSNEHHSNFELAKVFGVDEKAIRIDRKRLLRAYTDRITPEAAMEYVGRHLKSHDELIRAARLGLTKSPPGTLSHQNYLKILSDLETRKLKLLQEIGAVPKELGHINVTEERWQATVSTDGVVEVLPVQEEPKLLPSSVLNDEDDEEDDG